jgi:hypothetical protein
MIERSLVRAIFGIIVGFAVVDRAIKYYWRALINGHFGLR